MPNPDILFHVAEAETGTIPNSPGSYHGSALASVDRRIRLFSDGMMEVVVQKHMGDSSVVGCDCKLKCFSQRHVDVLMAVTLVVLTFE